MFTSRDQARYQEGSDSGEGPDDRGNDPAHLSAAGDTNASSL